MKTHKNVMIVSKKQDNRGEYWTEPQEVAAVRYYSPSRVEILVTEDGLFRRWVPASTICIVEEEDGLWLAPCGEPMIPGVCQAMAA